MEDEYGIDLPVSVGINQIPDLSPIDIQSLSINERLQRVEIAAGISTNPS